MDLPSLFSIGHSNKDIAEFINELTQFEIELLIDVRSYPYSRRFPHFNRETLMRALQEAGIEYIYRGNLLGGRPKDPSCYENGRVNYEILRKKAFFQQGIMQLVDVAQRNIKAAIMCSENNPAHCHRSLLIGTELQKHGVKLLHIVKNHTSNRVILKTQEEVLREAFPFGQTLFG